MVYKASSRTARATQRNPVSKTNKQNKNNKGTKTNNQNQQQSTDIKVWWCVSLILAFRRQRQEDLWKSEACQGYIMKLKFHYAMRV